LCVINGLQPGTSDGDQDGIDGDNDNPVALSEGNYQLTVTNTQTGCMGTGSTTIFKNSTPVFTQLVAATDQVLCNPDGRLVVNEVKVIDRNGVVQSNTNGDFPLSDFIFTYDRTTIGNTIPGGVTASFLDNTNYPAIGFDSYYVVATRTAGGPGLNCSSAPYKVDIQDRRLFPQVAFNSLANSSCNTLKPNGSVTANAKEQSGLNTGPYSFTWSLNSGALAPTSTQTDGINSSVIGNALDGTYVTTATNTVTGCPVNASFNLILDQVRSTPNIIDVLTVDPLDCNPSARAEVTKITLGSQTNSLLFPPNVAPNNDITDPLVLATFSYEWYQGTTNAADQLAIGGPAVTSPCIGPTCATPTVGLTAGKYFVFVQDPTTDCKSGPKEVVIKDDNIIYPVVTITQTVKQTSCIATTGTAALEALSTEEDGTTGTYNFTWYPSLDLTGSSLTASSATNNPNALTNLVVGNYSVEVQNTVTSCKASAFYIVPDDAPLYTPQVSLSPQGRTFCVGQDGSIVVRVLNTDPSYPFPYNATTFTADLYTGGSPNLSNPPDVPNLPFVPGFIDHFIESNLAEGFYTVRVTDNNTGCIGTTTDQVVDDRVFPAVVILEENPLTNCDPVRANGQLAATADGQVVGYIFDWFSGTAVPSPAPTPLSSGNVLIGKTMGSYTVRAANSITGCFTDKTGVITDKTLIPPVPSPSVLHHRTNCITPNGEVTVTVGGEVFNYTFNWYDGTAAAATPDFTDVNYFNLDIGKYAVTATDDITGCISPPGIVEVLDKRVKPEFTFESAPSYCSDVGKPKGVGYILINLTTPEVSIDQAVWTDEGTNAIVGTGPAVYELFPGFYHVDVTTTEGCTNDGSGEVKTEINPYNGISSDGDTQNDYFIIDCITNFPNNNVKIFNRSGILVYEIDGYNNADKAFNGLGLDGLYLAGKELPVGTYFYIIDKRDGSKPLAGYLELDR
jgi:hypothetical protein